MSRVNTIVIADKNADRRRAVVQRIASTGEIRECENWVGLLQMVADTAPAVVVIGAINNGLMGPEDAAHLVRDIHPASKVVIVADASSEAAAIRALKAGVFEYLIAPADPLEISEAVSRALPAAGKDIDKFKALIGASEPMRAVKDLIRRIAPLNSTVLITGESGTGKEIVAQLVHDHSLRAGGPFVCVNCAALPDSLLESELFGHERGAFTGALTKQQGHMKMADGGSLFLDEIGDLSLLAQSKMLRALEQREVQPLGGLRPVPINIRLITATHRNLEKLVDEKRFRGDLFYRLDVSRIDLPPLRERPSDIPILAMHFLRELNREQGRQIDGFTPGALRRLVNHDWPGNVRQLRNAIESASVICDSDQIGDPDLRALHSSVAASAPAVTTASTPIPTQEFRPGKDDLMEALEATKWNVTKTAELLKWSRSTVYRQVAKYQLERPDDGVKNENSEIDDISDSEDEDPFAVNHST